MGVLNILQKVNNSFHVGRRGLDILDRLEKRTLYGGIVKSKGEIEQNSHFLLLGTACFNGLFRLFRSSGQG